jgi:hypothetical protein
MAHTGGSQGGDGEIVVDAEATSGMQNCEPVCPMPPSRFYGSEEEAWPCRRKEAGGKGSAEGHCDGLGTDTL